MDTSLDTTHQLFATISFVTSCTTCAVWWFAFTRFHQAGVFLALALIQTFALIMSIDNIHLAFTERTLIVFSSGKAQIAYFNVVSYIQVSTWILQAVAFVFLVRWIVRNVPKSQNAAS